MANIVNILFISFVPVTVNYQNVGANYLFFFNVDTFFSIPSKGRAENSFIRIEGMGLVTWRMWEKVNEWMEKVNEWMVNGEWVNGRMAEWSIDVMSARLFEAGEKDIKKKASNGEKLSVFG